VNKTLLALTLAITFSASTAFAQQDADGCKDHPLLTRLSNFFIQECQQNFNAVDFQTGAGGKKESVEGNVTTITYVFNEESQAKKPSPLQIVRNYEAAIVGKGGKRAFSGADDVDGGPMGATFSMTATGKEYWVAVRKMYEPNTTGEVGAFSLIVLEKEAMKQDVEASELFKELNKTGFIALYINFETGKSDIKSESQKTIDQILQMLKDNPSLRVSIEGHTDNVGAPQSNQTLSENRAKAIMASLVARGIDGARLASKGWGPTKPVGDNKTEEGRAKNRRVEIVKL